MKVCNMGGKLKIAILIINYNGKKDTIECLRSIDEHMYSDDRVLYKVILVDNGSRDCLRTSDIEDIKSEVVLLKSADNLGFAGGNNYGYKFLCDNNIEYDYLLLLNNDTVVVDDSIAVLAEELEKSNYGIGGLVNYYYSNPSKIWQSGTFFRTNKLKDLSIKTNSEKLEFCEVDAVPGSSLMIKKKIVDKIGLLDDRYFAYYEEFDLCARAKNHGYTIGFLNSTRLLHKVGKSSPSLLKHYLRTRNTLLFYKNNYAKDIKVGYARVIIRSILLFLRKLSWGYFKAMYFGIKDYKKGTFYQGNILKFS